MTDKEKYFELDAKLASANLIDQQIREAGRECTSDCNYMAERYFVCARDRNVEGMVVWSERINARRREFAEEAAKLFAEMAEVLKLEPATEPEVAHAAG